MPQSAAPVAVTLREAVARGAEQGRLALRASGAEGEGRTRGMAPTGEKEAEAAPGPSSAPEASRGRLDDLLPMPPTGTISVQEAVTFSSQQPWGLGLDQPGVLAQLVEDAESERKTWQEYYQIGVSLQQTLRHACELHVNRARQVHQVSVSVFV